MGGWILCYSNTERQWKVTTRDVMKRAKQNEHVNKLLYRRQHRRREEGEVGGERMEKKKQMKINRQRQINQPIKMKIKKVIQKKRKHMEERLWVDNVRDLFHYSRSKSTSMYLMSTGSASG